MSFKRLCSVVLVAFWSILEIGAQSITTKIHPNGSFDIIGASIQLRNCYPAINETSLKPLSVKVIKTESLNIIRYKLPEGTMEISLSVLDTLIKLETTFKGAPFAAENIYPIHNAIVNGADKYYRNPASIAGNAGVHVWPVSKSEESSMLTGLIPVSGSSLIISTRDMQKYVSFSSLYTNSSKQKCLDVAIQTENSFSTSLPTIYISENKMVYQGMRCEAAEIAKTMKVKNDKPQSYHWCSWYYAYFYLTQNMLSEYIKGFKSVSPQVPIQTIQIDAGYHPHVGDWLEPSSKFPNGLTESVKEILDNGYKAGIWIGPYMVGNRSKLFTEHPDWILCNTDGSPIVEMTFYGENRLWGAQDEEYYALDTSNPAVMDYLRNVFRTFRKMGITFFKTDFMVYGNRPSHTVKRHTPGKTAIEYQHEFFNMIRQEIGPESFWLGCIAPFAPMLGYVDGMRISGDISADWEHGRNMFDESKGCQHLNNVWWQNDPDAIILRKKHNSMTDDEAVTLATWMGMLGGMVNTSDLLHELPKDRLDLFRSMEPSKSKITASFPFLDKKDDFEIMVRKVSETKSEILFVNRNDKELVNSYNINQLLETTDVSFTVSTNTEKQIIVNQSITVRLKAHESKIYYVMKEGK